MSVLEIPPRFRVVTEPVPADERTIVIEAGRAFGQLEQSFSWKVTKPLRWAKQLPRSRAS